MAEPQHADRNPFWIGHKRDGLHLVCSDPDHCVVHGQPAPQGQGGSPRGSVAEGSGGERGWVIVKVDPVPVWALLMNEVTGAMEWVRVAQSVLPF